MVPHATRGSAGNLAGRDERRETFVEYNVLHVYPWPGEFPWCTTECATAFSAPDWLYSSRHGVNENTEEYRGIYM